MVVASRSFEDIVENAVTKAIEHVFDSGELPEGLKKAIEAAVEKSVKKAIEQAEFNSDEAGGTASSGPTSSGTASSGPASSKPGKDKENKAELDETVVFINMAGRGVYHRPGCRHVKPTSRRFRACMICREQ